MAPSLEEWVADLASGHDARLTKAAVRQSAHGKGLFASEPVKRGDVVASVPKKLTLWVQEGNALALPGDGAWPRVRAGASAAAPLAMAGCRARGTVRWHGIETRPNARASRRCSRARRFRRIAAERDGPRRLQRSRRFRPRRVCARCRRSLRAAPFARALR